MNWDLSVITFITHGIYTWFIFFSKWKSLKWKITIMYFFFILSKCNFQIAVSGVVKQRVGLQHFHQKDYFNIETSFLLFFYLSIPFSITIYLSYSPIWLCVSQAKNRTLHTLSVDSATKVSREKVVLTSSKKQLRGSEWRSQVFLQRLV